jgi:hypothetical protein
MLPLMQCRRITADVEGIKSRSIDRPWPRTRMGAEYPDLVDGERHREG